MGQEMIVITPECCKKNAQKTPKQQTSEVYFRQQESKVERHDMSLLCRYVIIPSTVWLDINTTFIFMLLPHGHSSGSYPKSVQYG